MLKNIENKKKHQIFAKIKDWKQKKPRQLQKLKTKNQKKWTVAKIKKPKNKEIYSGQNSTKVANKTKQTTVAKIENIETKQSLLQNKIKKYLNDKNFRLHF